MIILILGLILVLFFIIYKTEGFELIGENSDIFQIKDETINTEVPCYINNDSDNIGNETILTTNENKNIQTCDFGEAINKSCDHIQFTCKNDRCDQTIKSVLNINGEYRCRKFPYLI